MYTREASTLDLFTDSIRCMGDATLCGVMEFDRQLDPVLLRGAAQACLLAHPILHSRLVRGDGPAFWVMVDDPVVPPLEPEPCDAVYHPRVIGPVDPYGPLQFRVRLLRRPSGDVVVVNLAHAAADAYGLHVLMAQLLQEYEAPGSVRPSEGGIPVRDTLWTGNLNPGIPPKDPDIPLISPLWPDPFGTSRGAMSFHRECIGPDELEAVHAQVQARGGSLNDAVVAAYYLAISDLTGHAGLMDISFPVNLRQHLADGSRVMSNQATNISFPLDRNDGGGMDTILPRVIAATQKHKAEGIGIAGQAWMDRASDPEGRTIQRMVDEVAIMQKGGLADIFLTNPGPVELPALEGLTGAYVCYPGGYMPTTCFVTSTFRGCMTVTMGYQDSERPREATRKAMELFRTYLLSLAGAGRSG